MSKRQRSRVLPRKLTGLMPADDIFPNDVPAFVTKQKTSDETVTSSTTFQSDDELFFPVRTGETWDVEAIILYQAATASDIKWQFDVPGTESSDGLVHRYAIGATGTGDDLIAQATSAGSSSGGTGADNTALHIRMLITVGASDGNITFQWAQDTSGGTGTIVRSGSYLVARKVS